MPIGVYVRTEAHRLANSLAHLGIKMPSFSDDHKRKLSIANSGKHATLVTRERQRLAKLGKPGVFKTEAWRKNMSESQRGIRAHNWQGGLTALHKLIRNSFEYRQWRTRGYERDSYRCVVGGISHGKKLNFDHKKSLAAIIRENNIKTFADALLCGVLWDINNGRTLCEDCHKKTDTWGWRSRNQLYEK